MASTRINRFPFSAVVGQPFLKKSLIANAVDGTIGGVLIFGQRGTAKSTIVRAMADLLPEQNTVRGCPYGCDPDDPAHMCDSCLESLKNGTVERDTRKMGVVELPVSSTEDKVVGSLDIESAIRGGRRVFEPGVLAAANRNILYVDEINLLGDHIVDAILDSAASGVNTIEREGVSFSHPSRFILVGTMNPEEGDLRPQLLDRFGLAVYIQGIDDEKKRMVILRRLRERDSDTAAFMERWKPFDERISRRIIEARERLPKVQIGEDMIRLAIDKVLEANAEGHRADTAIVKTAAALAAYEGREVVEEKDIEIAAYLALAHRSRDPPPPPPQEPEEEEDEEPDDEPPEDNEDDGDSELQSETPPPPTSGDDTPSETDRSDIPDSEGDTVTFETGEEFRLKEGVLPTDLRIDSMLRDSTGRRTDTESDNGRYVGYRMPSGKPRSIALDATIRAAAAHMTPGSDFEILDSDIREKVRERKIGNLIVFAVDASGSMGAEQRMSAAKGAAASILTDAYQKRDRVAMVVFRGKGAEIVLPPTNSVVLAKERMDGIPTGGRTPLADALRMAADLIDRERFQDKEVKPLLVVISDGRGNVPCISDSAKEDTRVMAGRIAESGYPVLIIDSESGFLKLGMAQKLADDMHARYVKLEDLKADSLMGAIDGFRTVQ